MKRAISLLLSLVMIVSVMVVTPINAGATQEQNNNYSSKVNEDITMTGNNSLGTMLASEFEEDATEQEGESECGIYGIEMDGSIAYVDIQTFIDATLIVGIFDENTDEMYCSGMVNVGKDDTIVVVKIETDTLPQYYMVKAFLVDRESKTPLCKQYECDTYTTVMQEFLSKTTDDFAEEDVLNLDESEDNNFLVYGEDTIVVDNTDESKNVVQTADEENREYVIENIDDTIASLKEGDIFTYEYGEEGLLIIKVSSITIDGTTATIYGDEITLEEAFDYIKIDTADYSSEMNVDNSNLDEDVEFVGVEEPEVAQTGAPLVNDKLALATSLKYKIKEKKFGTDSSISGNIAFKAGVELSCYYDAKLFEEDEIKLSLKIDYELGVDITVELKGKYVEIPIGKCFLGPLAIVIEFTPNVVLEGEVTTELKGVLTGQVNKQFNNGNFYDHTKTPTFETTLTFEAKVFFGVEFEVGVSVLWGTLEGKMEVKGGVQIKAELEYTTDDFELYGERHLCKSCIEGELSYVMEIGFEFNILKREDLTFEATAFEYNKKFADFYYSIDNNKFALTTCPNKTYKQIIKVFDSSGTAVKNATVNEDKTNSKGEVVLYLTKGNHTLNVTDGKVDMSYSIVVTEAGVHRFTLNQSDSSATIIGGVVTASDQCGDNVYYKLYGDTLEIYGTGDMWDGEGKWSKYRDKITKVVIRNGVTSIGDDAFECYHNLESVSIPNSVTVIGAYAFDSCWNLQNINIPNGVTYIGKRAFYNCGALKSITLHAKTEIESTTFVLCNNLTINVDPNNQRYVFVDSALYSKDMKTLICYLDNDVCTSYTIPNSVTKIEDGAVYCCENLRSISIPSSVTYIGYDAFIGNENLNSITIPDSVTFLGDYAFAYCSGLKSVTLSNSLTTIGKDTFVNCYTLESVFIPDSITSIEERAFYYCSSLKDVYYSGTASQWKAISKGSYNEDLTNATIHYNSSKSVAATSSAINSDVEIKPKKTDIASVGAGAEQSYSREHLVAGSEALFVVVEGSVDDFEITPQTLLYIGQTTVDENGCASIDVSQDFSSYNAVALIFGDCDHSASVWSMSVEPTFEVEGLNVCMCDYCENVIDTEDLTFLGDVDISGHTDIVDATYIQKFIALFDDIAEPELMFADVNDDGVVSIMDATLIQMYLAQLIT